MYCLRLIESMSHASEWSSYILQGNVYACTDLYCLVNIFSMQQFESFCYSYFAFIQTHHFLRQLFSQQLVLDALLLHLQTLLVIVERQLLQGLQNFLHLGLGWIVLGLQPAELRLHPLAVTPRWGQQLREVENSRIYTVNVYIMAVTISPPKPSVLTTNYWTDRVVYNICTIIG